MPPSTSGMASRLCPMNSRQNWHLGVKNSNNSWKLFENSICDGDFYGVGDENFDEFLKQSICDGDSQGVEDESFGEFLAKSICNKDFQGLKIPFISRKYLQAQE